MEFEIWGQGLRFRASGPSKKSEFLNIKIPLRNPGVHWDEVNHLWMEENPEP